MAEKREALEITNATVLAAFDGEIGEELPLSAEEAGYSTGKWAAEHGMTLTWDDKGLFRLG